MGGRREARSLMPLEEEPKILKQIEKQALSGQILIYKQVKSLIDERSEKSVSDDYVWDLFKRHKWTKKVPRQSHLQADKEAQEAYKKIPGTTGIPIIRFQSPARYASYSTILSG
jgi:transposase